jgi:CelD/BcsL family acetyltransferase involved in cellulose biosynthesis
VLAGAEILARMPPSLWRSVVRQVDDSPYYLQYEMVRGYLEHLRMDAGHRREPLALLLKRNGVVVGIMVLERDAVVVSGLRLPALSLTSHPHSPQSDVLLARGESLQSFWPAIARALSERDIRWEIIRCPAARSSSAIWRDSRSTAFEGRVVSHPVGHADYFDCRGAHANLEARYGSSLRRRLGQAQRQLARMGRIGYTCHRGGAPGAADAFQKFLDLECAGWKGMQRTAIAQSPALVAHYERLYSHDTLDAWSEVHLMTLDEKAIAAQFCIVSGGIREVVKLAYDETLRKQSPGNVMLDHMLEISCDDPQVTAFGLVGRPDWLAEWSPSSHDVHDIWIFRRPVLAHLSVVASRLKRSAIEFLQQTMRGGAGRRAEPASLALPTATAADDEVVDGPPGPGPARAAEPIGLPSRDKTAPRTRTASSSARAARRSDRDHRHDELHATREGAHGLPDPQAPPPSH